MKVEVFKLAYNKIDYSNYARTYKRLIKELYIFEIAIKLHEFLRYCLYC